MSRATRQITSAMDATPLLKEIFQNKKNTRKLQEEFGKKLAVEGIKTYGEVRKDSGGNRTWMTLPKIFGLCYEDKNKIVRFTQAGKIVAKGGKPAMQIMMKQILTFQYPNRTQERENQKMDPKFKIFPYRFLIKVLLKMKNLTVQEIELFVLPVSSDEELENVCKNIKMFREKKLIANYEKHKNKYKKDHNSKLYKKYINDLANTFKNHLEFLPGISSKKDGGIHQLFIESNSKQKWKDTIKKYDIEYAIENIYPNQERKFFVDRYGLLPGKKKASTKTSKPVTKEQTKIRKIQSAIVHILEKNLNISKSKMITEIFNYTFISKTEIQRILSAFPEFVKTKYSNFEKKYLAVAGNGNKWKEFETMSNQIFSKFGVKVDHQKKIALSDGQKGFLDGYITFGDESGLIDSKAGKGFSCSNDKVGVMKDYISEASKISDKHSLRFFGYVYGRKFSNIGGFDRICKQTKVNGFRISAVNLLQMMKTYDENKISKEEIWILLQKNGEITPLDY
ncbi:AlwI family type II restriction endonuclease [Nitrosopumilus sp.]|uniref:AlwI family type II restriction endonuclease n=1 Tax=Nitrosopumilus sp. TaxID=2024843 RepID=UPI003D119A7C